MRRGVLVYTHEMMLEALDLPSDAIIVGVQKGWNCGFEFAVVHPSMPEVIEGGEAPQVPLPREKPDVSIGIGGP